MMSSNSSTTTIDSSCSTTVASWSRESSHQLSLEERFRPASMAEDLLIHQSNHDYLKILAKYLKDDELNRLNSFVYETIPSTPEEILLSLDFFKDLMKRFIPQEQRKQLTKSKRAHIVKAAFTAAIVRYVVQQRRYVLPSPEELKRYTFYDSGDLVIIEREEVLHLLGFIRILKVMLSLGLNGEQNKHLFLNVCSILEGSGKFYATGGAPSKATKRREIIYQDIAVNCVSTQSCVFDSSLGKRGPIENDPDDAPAPVVFSTETTADSVFKKRGRPRRRPMDLPMANTSISIASISAARKDGESEVKEWSTWNLSGSCSPHSDITGESSCLSAPVLANTSTEETIDDFVFDFDGIEEVVDNDGQQFQWFYSCGFVEHPPISQPTPRVLPTPVPSHASSSVPLFTRFALATRTIQSDRGSIPSASTFVAPQYHHSPQYNGHYVPCAPPIVHQAFPPGHFYSTVPMYHRNHSHQGPFMVTPVLPHLMPPHALETFRSNSEFISHDQLFKIDWNAVSAVMPIPGFPSYMSNRATSSTVYKM